MGASWLRSHFLSKFCDNALENSSPRTPNPSIQIYHIYFLRPPLPLLVIAKHYTYTNTLLQQYLNSAMYYTAFIVDGIKQKVFEAATSQPALGNSSDGACRRKVGTPTRTVRNQPPATIQVQYCEKVKWWCVDRNLETFYFIGLHLPSRS